MVKKLLSVCLCCIFCAGLTFSADSEILPGAELSIRLFNRSIYYPGDTPTEPIEIQVTITNTGADTLRFKLADDHFFSLDFSALNTRNRSLTHTTGWLQRRTASQSVFFREISLEAGESYSFNENLKDYIAITSPGMYIISGSFYPELKRLPDESEPSITSNKLTLEVQPSPGAAAAANILPISPDTAEVLQPVRIPPDEVVSYILTARQKEHWSQFFLYLDLEEMLKRDAARGKRYKQSSENDRLAMIENYKSELMQEKVDHDIATIPTKFDIERTTYSKTDATVTVFEWFSYKTFTEKKRFTYTLTSRDGIWRVVNYSVDNLGTE